MAAAGAAPVIPIPQPERTRLLLRRLRIWFIYTHYQAPTAQQRLERASLRRLAAASASRRAPATCGPRRPSSPDAPSDPESETR
jgi:hypothetical protein